MKQIKLGEIANFINGYAFKPSDWKNEGLKIIRIQNLTDVNKPYNKTDKVVDDKYVVKKGDILVSWSATLGVFEWQEDNDALLNQHIFKVKPNEDLINKYYFKYALKHSIEKMLRFTHGSTMKHIVRNDFLNHEIPLVNIGDQKKITSILDRANELRKKRQQAIDLLDDYLKSVFLDMFGDPVLNKKGWQVKTAKQVTSCIVPGRDKPKSFSGDIPWVTTSDLIELGETSFSKAGIGLNNSEIEEVRAKIIPKNSVIFSCVGDLGIASVAGNDFVMNQQLHSFQCLDDLLPSYLMFNISFQKNYMYKMASKTTVPYMNKTVCNNIPVMIAPVSLQKEFDQILQKTNSLKRAMQTQLVEMDNQFNSLMQQYFKAS